MPPEAPARHDNISDAALDAYRARYGEWVTKDHIFSYVYGILHSPDYRERYADDLARLLPRIPEVATADAFRAFSEAGQRLLDLHIGYEEAEPYPLEERLKSGAPRWAGALPSTEDALGRSDKNPGPLSDRLQRLDHARRDTRRSPRIRRRSSVSAGIAARPLSGDDRQG